MTQYRFAALLCNSFSPSLGQNPALTFILDVCLFCWSALHNYRCFLIGMHNISGLILVSAEIEIFIDNYSRYNNTHIGHISSGLIGKLHKCTMASLHGYIKKSRVSFLQDANSCFSYLQLFLAKIYCN